MTPDSAESGSAMTEDAMKLYSTLIHVATELRTRLRDDEVGNAMMAATIETLLNIGLPRDELATWLRKIADAIEEETATPATPAGPLH